jgi:hypothetical protein
MNGMAHYYKFKTRNQTWLIPQCSRSQQRIDQRVLGLILKFLALKKLFLPRKKYFTKIFDFLSPLFYATFQCQPYNIFKKYSNLFFANKNIKKRASKVAHNSPETFFHMYGPAAQTSPELIFHIINMPQDSSFSLSVVDTYSGLCNK